MRVFVRCLLILLGITAVVLVTIWLKAALVVIFVAFFLALVLDRPVKVLTRFFRSRALSALIVISLVFLVVVAGIWAIAPLFIEQAGSILSAAPSALESLQDSGNWLHDIATQHNLEGQYSQAISGLQDGVAGLATDAGNIVLGIFGGLINTVLSGFLIIVIVFFMLMEGEGWVERFWRLVYKEEKRRLAHKKLADKMYSAVTGYVNGTIVIAVIGASLTGIGMSLLTLLSTVPSSVILPSMIVAFLCAFIPMFGAFISGAIIALLLLLYSWPAMLVFMAYFLFYQQIVNNIFVPHIFAKTVNISPLTVLIAIVLGTYSGGFIGILIAIPVAGCLQIILRDYLAKRKDMDLI